MNLQRTAAAAKAAGLAAAGLALLVFSQSSREGVSAGVSMCLNVLVPSLFPMMAVTNLFVKSGLCARLGKPLNGLTRLLFGVSGQLAPVIVMGLIGGYPVGAGGLAALYQKGAVTKQEASRAALFTVCAGPGFLVNFVGATVYGSTATGWMILAAQVLSVLLLGILTRAIFRKEKYNHSHSESKEIPLPFSQALVEAVYAAARSMLLICAFVLLFSAIAEILAQMIPEQSVLNAAYVVLEICTAVTKLSNEAPPALIAFAVGFGGLCVHFQIFSALGGLPVSKRLFFLFRILQGILTAALTELGLKMLPRQTAVFSTAQAENAAFFGGSALSGAVICGVLICFFISMKQTIKQ